MTPKLVTFDCAGTMVAVPPSWTLGAFAVDCARSIGLPGTVEEATIYQNFYAARLGEFVKVNMSRDALQQAAFWDRLAIDWFREVGYPTDRLDEMREASEQLGFGANSILFSLYDDVVPCLDLLDQMGIRAAVISNWDYSLHRVLQMFDLYDRFIVVKASLEEGVEKPDPRLFQITLTESGFTPEETFHVGDDPVDDLEGATSFGIRSVLLDRSLEVTKRPRIRSLLDLPEAFGWID